MKILLITQFFDPEPTFKGIIFAKELVSKGHDVEVLTGFPNYPGGVIYDGYKVKLYQKDVVDGVTIHRVPLYPSHNSSALKRIFNYVSFALTSAFCGVFKLKKYDVIYVMHPPITTGLSASIISFFRRTPYVIDIQDLWPDTLSATGMVNNQKVLNIVGYFCKFVYKRASQIVVLSPGFKKRLIERGVAANKIDIIYNWCDENSLISGVQSNLELPLQGFNVVFAGNLGFAQGLPAIIEATKLLSDKNIPVNIIFVGSGVALDGAKNLAGKLKISNLHFLPRVSIEEIGSVLKSADALLVHLTKNELFEITIPSRTQAYMYIGKPIIMGVKGDASTLVEEANAGMLCEPECPESLATVIKELYKLGSEELNNLGRNGRRYYKSNLSLSAGVEKFISTFEKVIK